MAQQLRGHTAVREDPSLIPSSHIRQLTTACNSSSRVSEASSLHEHLLYIYPTQTKKKKNHKPLNDRI